MSKLNKAKLNQLRHTGFGDMPPKAKKEKVEVEEDNLFVFNDTIEEAQG